MHSSLAAFMRTSAVAMTVAAFLPFTALHAQQQPPPVAPGTEATDAMGSKVETMKPECEPKTTTGERQQQHPPTAGLSEKVPTMTAQADCPPDSTQPKAK